MEGQHRRRRAASTTAAARSDLRGRRQTQAGELGISGVPFFVLDGRFGVSGAQPADTFTAVLDKAWSQRA